MILLKMVSYEQARVKLKNIGKMNEENIKEKSNAGKIKKGQ